MTTSVLQETTDPDLDLTSTSGVVCGQVRTNYPRGRGEVEVGPEVEVVGEGRYKYV